ncbi:MarR family winged helix-turn-helix transcriptional regulator [Halomonas sp. A29]|uniref:MarR family winged helix-turn-helix transcriptional regulator n=1 Tax=Halomonas sp. A29 TaxID=3102786 RepID=UPI00398B64A7
MSDTINESKQRLLEALGERVRKLGAQSVLTSHVVADRFGLHTTDLEVLDLLTMEDRALAGDIARATGLTPGATTALIDRLEKAGYVKREADERDRRRTVVVVQKDAIEPIARVYGPMQQRMFALWSEYSEDELRLITDFLARSTTLAATCAADIREKP